jgi:hypothetical protein
MSQKTAKTVVSDKKLAILKEVLYNPASRNAPQMNDEAMEQHEVIERMWALQKQRDAIAFRERLQRKYNTMRQAVEKLKETDERLFRLATEGEAYQPGDDLFRFSGKIRVPTETPTLEK